MMTAGKYSAFTIGAGVAPENMHALAPQWEAACKAELKQWEADRPFPLPGWSGAVWLDRIEARRRRWEKHYFSFLKCWWAERGYAVELDDDGMIAHIGKLAVDAHKGR